MKKIFKIFGIILATLIVLIIVGFIAIATLVNPNDFKGKISQIVQQNTGREFTIGGDISWRFFPWLGLKVENVAVGNASGFAGKNFAKVDELDASVRLIPLIFGEVKIGTINIENASLYLMKNKAGKTNWDDLTAPKAVGAAQPQASTAKSKNLKIDISGINVTNANVYWDDRQANETAQLTNLDFYSSISLDQAAQKYQLGGLKLNGNVKTSNMANTISYKLDGDFAIDLNNEIYTAKDFKLQVGELVVKGDIISKESFGAKTYQGKLVISKFNPTELLKDLGVNYRPQDESAFKSASASLSFQGSSAALKIPTLQINLDRSVLQGSISKLDLKHKFLNFALTLNEFNLNRYLPQAVTSKTNKSATTTQKKDVAAKGEQSAVITKTPSSVSQWSLNGNLTIGQLTVSKLRSSKVTIPLAFNKGIIALSPKADFYNGTFKGQMNIDLRSNLPRTTASLDLTKVNLEPLLGDLVNSNNISGTADFKVAISIIGSDLKSLNGKGSLAVDKGVLKFMDINSIFAFVKKISDIASVPANIVSGKNLPSFKPGSGVTKFDRLSATYVINNGVISNKDLLLTAADYKVTGQGTASLVSEKVDYLLTASTSAITVNKKNLGLLQIPVKISGTFANLHYYPDVAALLKSMTAGTLQNVGQAVGGALKKGGNLKDIGKNIGKSLGF
jgi:AsmA protein